MGAPENNIWRTAFGDYVTYDEDGSVLPVVRRDFADGSELAGNEAYEQLRPETQAILSQMVSAAAEGNYTLENLSVYTISEDVPVNARGYTVRNEIIEHEATTREYKVAAYKEPSAYLANAILENIISYGITTSLDALTVFGGTVVDFFNIPPQIEIIRTPTLFAVPHETKWVKLSWVYMSGDPTPFLGAQTQKVSYYFDTSLRAPNTKDEDKRSPTAVFATDSYNNPNAIAIQNRYDTYVERIYGYTLQITVDGKTQGHYFQCLS